MFNSSNGDGVTTTNIGPWDQLIFQREDMINQTFANMWANADEDSPLKSFTYKKPRSQERIEGGKLGPSTVECLVENSADLSSVYFFINFTAGTMYLYKSDHGDEMIELDVSGWHIACKVPINVDYVLKGSKEYNEILGRRPLPDFTFSLARLYLDVSRAQTLTDSKETTWGNTDWKTLTPTQRTEAIGFINTWLTFNNQAGLSALGYALEPDVQEKPGEKIMFAPTFMSRQVYPYIIPPNPPKNGNPNNSIVSKIMTNQNAEPDISQQPLNYSGNWVNDSSSGTFACSPSIFMEQWFLPIIQKINPYLQITPTQPTASVSKSGLSGSGSMGFWAGYNPAHRDVTEDYFKFKNVAPGSKDGQGHPIRYRWEVPQYELSASDHAGTKRDPLLEITYTGLTRTQVTISFDDGAQSMYLEGKTFAQAKADYKGSNTGWWDTYSHFGMTLTLNMVFTLNSVENGALQILVTPPPQSGKYYSLDAPNPEVKGGWSFSDNIPEVRKAIVGSIQKRLDQSIPWVLSTITTAFEDQEKIVFPAGGNYEYFDPIIQGQGTLLCGLDFNGANPPPSSHGEAGKLAKPDGHDPVFLRPHHLKRRVVAPKIGPPQPPDPTAPDVIEIGGKQ